MIGEMEGLIVESGQLEVEHGRCPAGKLERSGWEIIDLEGLGSGDEWAKSCTGQPIEG